MDFKLLEKVKDELKEGNTFEMAIVTKTHGDTERNHGAFFVIDNNENIRGSVGSGALQKSAINLAKYFLNNNQNYKCFIDIDGNVSEEIFNDSISYEEIYFFNLKNDIESFNMIDEIRKSSLMPPMIYLFGAGNINKEVAKLIHNLGYQYVIWDEDSKLSNRERFVGANAVVARKYDDIDECLEIRNIDFAIIDAEDKFLNLNIAKKILKFSPFYFGIRESEENSIFIKSKLIEYGIEDKIINEICMPIGINICAKNEKEIAVSIVAQIIMFIAKYENR